MAQDLLIGCLQEPNIMKMENQLPWIVGKVFIFLVFKGSKESVSWSSYLKLSSETTCF